MFLRAWSSAGVPPPNDGSERAMTEGVAGVVVVVAGVVVVVAAAFLGIMKYDVTAECYEVYII
jgi:hypothetical protein